MLTQDPIGLAGGVNLYAYARNNPVSYSDPYGLNPCLLAPQVCMAIAGAIIFGGTQLASNAINDRPLLENVGSQVAIGTAAGLSLGASTLVSGIGTTAASAGESVLFNGGREGLRSALSEGVQGISSGQAANLGRALSRGVVDNIKVTAGADGTITAELTRAGRNGYQVLTKVIDASGRTVRMVQTAYDKAGKVVEGEVWK